MELAMVDLVIVRVEFGLKTLFNFTKILKQLFTCAETHHSRKTDFFNFFRMFKRKTRL